MDMESLSDLIQTAICLCTLFKMTKGQMEIDGDKIFANVNEVPVQQFLNDATVLSTEMAQIRNGNVTNRTMTLGDSAGDPHPRDRVRFCQKEAVNKKNFLDTMYEM